MMILLFYIKKKTKNKTVYFHKGFSMECNATRPAKKKRLDYRMKSDTVLEKLNTTKAKH